MRKWIVAGVVLVVVVVAVLVAAANLGRWLDANHDLIEREASAALARPVQIGDLDVSLRGGLGIRVQGIRIAEDTSYGEGAFLTLDEGIVRVSIWPALFGRIEVSQLLLQAPRLRVVRDGRGLSTDSLAAGESEPAAEPAKGGFELGISSLVIEDGRIVIEDRTGRTPSSLEIERFDLALHGIEPGRPLDFELTATWLGAADDNFAARGQVGPLFGGGTGPISFDVSFEQDAFAIEHALRFDPVASSLPEGAKLSGEIGAKGALKGTAEALDFDVQLDGTQLAVALPGTFVKPPGASLLGEARGHLTPSEARIDAFGFGPERARIVGEAQIGLSDATPYSVRLRASSLPIEAWTPLLPAFEGTPVGGRFGLDLRAKGKVTDAPLPLLDGTFTLADASVSLSEAPAITALQLTTTLSGRKATATGATAVVGGAPVRFELEVADVNAPEIRFALDAAELPLAAVGVLEPGTETDDVLQELRVVGEADLRTEQLAANARFASPRGRLQGIAYERLEGRAEMSGPRTTLHELRMSMLGGDVHASGSLDSADPERPGFAGTLKLSGVEISEIVSDRFPLLRGVASGRLGTTLTLSGRGLETDAIRQSLTGMGSIEIRDGRLEGVNVAEAVLTGATGVAGLTSWLSPDVKRRHPHLFASPDTQFETAEMAIEVQDGRIRTDALAIVTDEFALTGKGTIGLDGRLDLDTEFRTSAALATTLVGVASPTRFLLDGDKRLRIPVHVGGELGAPKLRPDQKYLGQALARTAVGTVDSLVKDLIGSPSSGKKPATGEPGGASAAPPEAPASDESAPPAGSKSEPKPAPRARPKSVEGLIEQGLEELRKR